MATFFWTVLERGCHLTRLIPEESVNSMPVCRHTTPLPLCLHAGRLKTYGRSSIEAWCPLLIVEARHRSGSPRRESPSFSALQQHCFSFLLVFKEVK